MRQVRVLVVEDDPGSRMLLRELLEHRGWEVTEAPDVGSALRRLASTYDLVLLDIDLPGGPIDPIVEALEAREGGRPPIAVVTAHAMRGDRERFLARGFEAYFSKPIDVRTLVPALEQLLGRSRSRPGARSAEE